mgnify:CR=1 FL=1
MSTPPVIVVLASISAAYALASELFGEGPRARLCLLATMLLWSGAMIPVLARDVLGLGAGGYGALMTCVGAGAMLDLLVQFAHGGQFPLGAAQRDPGGGAIGVVVGDDEQFHRAKYKERHQETATTCVRSALVLPARSAQSRRPAICPRVTPS